MIIVLTGDRDIPQQIEKKQKLLGQYIWFLLTM